MPRTTFALVYIPAVGGVDPGQEEARATQAALAGVTVAAGDCVAPRTVLEMHRSTGRVSDKDGGHSDYFTPGSVCLTNLARIVLDVVSRCLSETGLGADAKGGT